MFARRRIPPMLAAAVLMGAVAAPAAAQMPTDPAEALRLFERETDVSDWDSGPVQYLFTRQERDIWDELDNDDERRDFVRWFWDRRDDDLRDRQHPFMEGFYTRVAAANDRFAGMPRGWRSDRGRVWIVLGRPDGIRASGLSAEVWIYNTYGGILKSSSYLGQMEVGFQQFEPSNWRIMGGVGPGAWPPYVLQAFDIVNRALIQQPDLEWKGGAARR